MKEGKLQPEIIFETSWEVCNKVGGIYTVLSSRAQTLKETYGDNLIFIGPDIWKDKENPDFKEDKRLLLSWRKAAEAEGVGVRIGRWQVEGLPVAVLVDFAPFFAEKNEIYTAAWNDFGVDSLHAYGDYDEASMFSFAAGKFVETLYRRVLAKKFKRIVYQAHEWMSGLGMLYLKKMAPQIATIFTTHATSIGRSIAGNNKLLYKYFAGYNGDQMAQELNMEAKHSIEKRSAEEADCFTTVSTFTDAECRQLLDKGADVVLPNGFDSAIVPKGAAFTQKRRTARKRLIEVAEALTGANIDENVLIVSTSGRNDYRCKGFDVYLEALSQLNLKLKATTQETRVLALVEVPCWLKGPRADLQARLSGEDATRTPLNLPMLTHDLYNVGEDRILNTMRGLVLWNEKDDPVKVLLVPCYLDGRDGIINLPYYDVLTANDLCIYPSYYEPWGYTPLEACAFHTPCITTDLSGFGQWVNATLGHDGTAADGVVVLHRDDDNYFDVAHQIADIIDAFGHADANEIASMRKRAQAMAAKAQWKHFIGHYFEAYNFALSKK